MGNTATSSRKGSKQLVTILQSDGRVLEFSRPLRVSDLLYDYPGHFVCHSSALVLMNNGKMLPPNTLLLKGDVYFLLPLPKQQSALPASTGSENDPLMTKDQSLQGAKPGGTMKFVISKQQLAKILAEGSIKMMTKGSQSLPLSQLKQGGRSTSSRLLHSAAPTLVKRTVTWSPGLESISEVPVM